MIHKQLINRIFGLMRQNIRWNKLALMFMCNQFVLNWFIENQTSEAVLCREKTSHKEVMKSNVLVMSWPRLTLFLGKRGEPFGPRGIFSQRWPTLPTLQTKLAHIECVLLYYRLSVGNPGSGQLRAAVVSSGSRVSKLPLEKAFSMSCTNFTYNVWE